MTRSIIGPLIAASMIIGTLSAAAQPKTDVATLRNGDRITGEVKALERGRLEFSTDDAGTLYLEWEKLVSVVAATHVFELVTSDGQRFVGTLTPAQDRQLGVTNLSGSTALDMGTVTLIIPIGASFWKRLDGSFDAGFNYTRSSGVAQLNLNWDTIFRRPASSFRLTASLTQTQTTDEEGRDDRGWVEFGYLRYPWRRWYYTVAGRFETNESLGLELRSAVAATAGPRLINTNRAQMTVGAGLGVNEERGIDVEPTTNIEGVLTFKTAYFTYDRPKTSLDISLQYHPSISDPGRQRVQFDADARQEIWKDLFLSVNFYNTFDSRPPNPSADRNDVGIVTSIGWTY